MDLNLLITNLKNIDKKDDITAYIFGSFLKTQYTNDIDILLVYGEKYSVMEAISLRHDLSKLIMESYHVFADICLLSQREREYKLIVLKESAVMIYPITKLRYFQSNNDLAIGE